MEWLCTRHLATLITLLALSPLLQVADGLKDSLKCPERKLKGGRVRIRGKGRVAKYICLRGSQVVGDKYSTCVHGKWDSPIPLCVKSGCLPVDVPHGQVLDTYRGAFVTVHCDLGYILVGSQSLYCNGAVWNGTAPTCKEIQVKAQKWCDFESEYLCGWTHDSNHDFDWKRHNFATPSGHVGTGPSFDHTLGPGLSGYYMYLEVSSPRLENDTARLFSPVFSAIGDPGACFIFWYHMFGTTTGTLNVYLHKQDTVLLFTKTGDQGDQWLQAVIPLPQINSSFQIVMEGVRGAGYKGDIAIDDVKLAEGEECSVSISTTSADDDQVTDADDQVTATEDQVTATDDQVTAIDDQVTATEKADGSCDGRCFLHATHPDMCECVPDCIKYNSCCPDYLQKCSTSGTKFTGSTSISTSFRPTADDQVTAAAEADISCKGRCFTHATHPNMCECVPVCITYNSCCPDYIQRCSTSTSTATSGSGVATVKPHIFPVEITTKTKTTTIPTDTTSNFSALPNNSVTYTASYLPSSNNSQIIGRTSKTYQTEVSASVLSSNNSIATIVATVPTTSRLSPAASVPYINRSIVEQTTFAKMANQTESTTTLNKTPPVTAKPVPTTLSLRTTTQIVFPNTWPPTRPSNKRTTVPFNMDPQRSTRKVPKVLKQPKIEFVTPTPPVVFRRPIQPIWPFLTPIQNGSVAFPTQIPKKIFNRTEKFPNSKNDVLHPVWLKDQFTTPKLTSLGLNPARPTTTKTASNTTQPTTTQPPPTFVFRQLNSSKSTAENKWKSKYKPKDEAPIHAQFAVPTSPSGHMVHILVLVSGVLLILAMALATACVMRRRKINRRRMEDDELDIQFLASDEILDFTLARPSIEDIQMHETRR